MTVVIAENYRRELREERRETVQELFSGGRILGIFLYRMESKRTNREPKRIRMIGCNDCYKCWEYIGKQINLWEFSY